MSPGHFADGCLPSLLLSAAKNLESMGNHSALSAFALRASASGAARPLATISAALDPGPPAGPPAFTTDVRFPCFQPLATDEISSPAKTSDTAAHCCGSSGLPLSRTERRMLKNLRVVHTSVLASEPKRRMVAKMNSCPTAPHRQNSATSHAAWRACGRVGVRARVCK